MSGLDNIVKKIRAQAKTDAGVIEKELSSFKKEYVGKTKSETSDEIKKIANEAAKERAVYEEKVKSNGEFRQRNAILKAKGEIIDETISKALEELKSLDDAAYFDVILNVIESNVQSKDGQIRFSKKDLDRMPAQMEEKISSIAQSAGGSLVLSKDAADIDDGFVLVYGDIEENCTFDALFAAKRDELRDIANKNLFE